MRPGSVSSFSGLGRVSMRSVGVVRRGVTMITSSVSLRCQSADLNRAPRTGTSAAQGTWFTARIWLFSKRPAMAKLWPSRSSTWVEARRVLMAGTWKPWIWTPLRGSSWLTSGAIFRRIWPESSTVGVTFSFTPKVRNSMVTPLLPLGTGKGNSPPARKLASCPDIAVRFGRARVWTAPRCSRARKVASTLQGPKWPPTLIVPAGVLLVIKEPLVLRVKPDMLCTSRLTPRSFSAEREASMIRTSTMICSAAFMVRADCTALGA